MRICDPVHKTGKRVFLGITRNHDPWGNYAQFLPVSSLIYSLSSAKGSKNNEWDTLVRVNWYWLCGAIKLGIDSGFRDFCISTCAVIQVYTVIRETIPVLSSI